MLPQYSDHLCFDDQLLSLHASLNIGYDCCVISPTFYNCLRDLAKLLNYIGYLKSSSHTALPQKPPKTLLSHSTLFTHDFCDITVPP